MITSRTFSSRGQSFKDSFHEIHLPLIIKYPQSIDRRDRSLRKSILHPIRSPYDLALSWETLCPFAKLLISISIQISIDRDLRSLLESQQSADDRYIINSNGQHRLSIIFFYPPPTGSSAPPRSQARHSIRLTDRPAVVSLVWPSIRRCLVYVVCGQTGNQSFRVIPGKKVPRGLSIHLFVHLQPDHCIIDR